MTNPTETKIELLTESIEALTLAQIVAVTPGTGDQAVKHQNVLDARAVVKRALREFLQPTLRVVPNSEHVPYGGAGIEGMKLG